MIIKIATPQTIHELGNRTNQEDALYPNVGEAGQDDRVFIVCDGMGGHEKGEVASNTVCEAVAGYLKEHFMPEQLLEDKTLLNAIDTAYLALDNKDDGSPKKMGTTFTFVGLHKGGVTVAYIGDSRVYHIRPQNGRVCMQTRDHSLVYDLYQAGEISFEEMATHPRKNIITKAMQPGGDYRVLPDFVHITDVQAGDYFYLCSDGMLEQMSNEQLTGIFAAATSDEEKAKTLVEATAGNNDNHTAIFFRVESVMPEPSDGALFVNDEDTSRSNAVNIKPIVMDVELDDSSAEAIPSAYPPSYPQQSGSRPPSYPPVPQAAPNGNSQVPSPTPNRSSINPLYYVAGVVVLAIVAYLLVSVFKGSSGDQKPPQKEEVKAVPNPTGDSKIDVVEMENADNAQQNATSDGGINISFDEYMKLMEDKPIELMGKWYICQKGEWYSFDKKVMKPGKKVGEKEQEDLQDAMRGKWEKERTAPSESHASGASSSPETDHKSATDVVNAIDAVSPNVSPSASPNASPSSSPSSSSATESSKPQTGKSNNAPRVPFKHNK